MSGYLNFSQANENSIYVARMAIVEKNSAQTDSRQPGEGLGMATYL